MSEITMEGVRFAPPPDFEAEELVLSWRVPGRENLSDPKLMVPQATVRPNLTLTRVQVADPDLEAIAAHTCNDLMERIKGVEGMKVSQLRFSDGVDGVLIEYAFPAMQFVVVQMQALRIDGDTLSTLVVCTETSRLTPEVRERYLESIASFSIGGDR